MDAEAYRNLKPQYTELLSQVVDSNIRMLDTLRMYGAAQDAVLGQENKQEQIEYVNKLKQSNNKIHKSYQLMRALTGNGPIAAYNDDDMPDINRPRFFGGSQREMVDKSTKDKVEKSYRLMQLLTGGH